MVQLLQFGSIIRMVNNTNYNTNCNTNYNINNDTDNNNEIFLDKIFCDIKSNKPYSQKIHLQKFNEMIKIDKTCNPSCNNCYRANFHNNFYGSNNVIITDLNSNKGQICTIF